MRCRSGFVVVLSALAFARTATAQNRVGPSPALRVNTPPVALFLGNRAGVSPALQVNTPPMPLFLGNPSGVSPALQVPAAPSSYSSPGTGSWQTPTINRQPVNWLDRLRPEYVRFGWFERPDVQQQLGITDQQRQILRDDIDWARQQREQIDSTAQTDPTGAEQLYRSYRQEYRERLNQLLAPDQKRAWWQLAGQLSNYQPSFMSTATEP